MRRATAVVVVVAALTAGIAGASEQSKRLQSRGLVEFHAGRYASALTLFEQAVADDADDVYARYYRGVTYGRLGNYDAALADLQAVIAAKPELDQAALDLGVTLVQTGRYREALPWLERAQHVTDLDAQASLFLGLAQLRLGQLAEARPNFGRAGKSSEWTRAAQYYEGIVDYQEGKSAAAEQHFAAVAGADSEMGREATAFLRKMRQREPTSYQLYASAGFQYDSNVVLAPADAAIKSSFAISKQADSRLTLDAGGQYSPWRSEAGQLSVGYEVFQSLHNQLTDFNVQDHRTSAQLMLTPNPDSLRLGLMGRYDYYLLDTGSFLQEATVLPWVNVLEGRLGRTELSYRMRRRDFKKRSFAVRNAINHAAVVRQYGYLGSPDRYVWAGYQFDRETPVVNTRLVPRISSESFVYDGDELNTGIGWVLPGIITAELGYAYRYERYEPASQGRRDKEHQIVASARRALIEHVDLTAAYIGTVNKSTDGRFDYERHVLGLALEVRF